MKTKLFAGLVVAVALASAGFAWQYTSQPKAEAKVTDCCYPGAECCEAGLPCCATGVCCDDAKSTAAAKPAKKSCCTTNDECCDTAEACCAAK